MRWRERLSNGCWGLSPYILAAGSAPKTFYAGVEWLCRLPCRRDETIAVRCGQHCSSVRPKTTDGVMSSQHATNGGRDRVVRTKDAQLHESFPGSSALRTRSGDRETGSRPRPSINRAPLCDHRLAQVRQRQSLGQVREALTAHASAAGACCAACTLLSDVVTCPLRFPRIDLIRRLDTAVAQVPASMQHTLFGWEQWLARPATPSRRDECE